MSVSTFDEVESDEFKFDFDTVALVDGDLSPVASVSVTVTCAPSQCVTASCL